MMNKRSRTTGKSNFQKRMDLLSNNSFRCPCGMSNGSLVISGDCKEHMSKIASVQLYSRQRKIKDNLWNLRG